MRVADLLTRQQIHGWRFDIKAAQALEETLRTEVEALSRGVIHKHPYVAGKEFTPKRSNRTVGYVADATLTKLIDTNVTSRDHIAWILKTHYGWEPSKFTETNKAVVNEVTLKEIGSEEGLTFHRMFELNKQLGLLTNGKGSWLKSVVERSPGDFRIHHRCKVDTVTHRCSHSSPNLAQTPADLRFRSLFLPDKGEVMVGADLSAIELRMLAHYLARYDDGAYADIVHNSDPHQVSADRIGISRKQVKTVTYAFIYGAGFEKIGTTYDPALKGPKAAKKGKEIHQAFLDSVPGLEQLVKAVKQKVKMTGYVNSIDGRKITSDSEHKALNRLLQSGAGVVAKRWMVLSQVPWAHQLAFIHDELQYSCDPNSAEQWAGDLEINAAQAGEFYNLRVPIAAEAKIGANWGEVH